jgi:uncharacterized coiled-coil protein SlyX
MSLTKRKAVIQSEEQTQLVIQGLQDSLAEAANKVVSLEKELGRLIEGNMAENDRDIELSDSITSDLENALANAEKTIAELQDQLASRDYQQLSLQNLLMLKQK